MFKVGEKVVPIDDGLNKVYSGGLKLNKVYIISKISNCGNLCHLKEKYYFRFSKDRFKSLTQIRKEKIEKICSRLDTK
jgi:hypothetical protein